MLSLKVNGKHKLMFSTIASVQIKQ